MPVKRNFLLMAIRNKYYFFILAVAAGMFLSACSGQKSEQQIKKPAVPVTVAVAAEKNTPVQLRAIGNVEAYSTIAVKAQIGGELTKVHFKEGQDVNKGDLLFTIDPRPYDAALKQAEASLARDSAQLENAGQEARRYEELSKKGYVSQSQYDQMRTNADALEAVVRADRALVENAKLQLNYCFIHAPISGRTGSLMVNQGNLIKANADTPMVILNKIQPINVTFAMAEQYLSDIKRYMSARKLKVEVLVNNDDPRPVQGELTFIDNTVDATTGTIKLKAAFSNKDKRLWPGQFVNTVLTLTSQPNAVTVPSQAVQTGQNGQYVFIVKNDLTVESRPVVSVRTFNNEAVIEKGLLAGEKVVTDGHARLISGTSIEIKEPDQGRK